MKRIAAVMALASATGENWAAERPDAKRVDSGPVLRILRADIAARPSRVLIAVEDALTMNEQAACEIVREAMTSTRADPKLTGEIVFTALNCAPAMAATIIECATAASPQAVGEIKAAVQRVFGERSAALLKATEPAGDAAATPSQEKLVVTGKTDTGKGPVAAESVEITESFDLSIIGVGGIYLLTPASARPPFCDPANPCCNGDLTPSCLRP